MAIDPSIISALQGPQASFGLGGPPMPAPSGLFGVPPQHLQQMAGDVVAMPGAWGLMFNTIGPAGRSDMPGRYVSYGPRGDLRFYGPDPQAGQKIEDPKHAGVRSLPEYRNYIQDEYGQGGGFKSFTSQHPSPMEMMRYFRQQGLLPD